MTGWSIWTYLDAVHYAAEHGAPLTTSAVAVAGVYARAADHRTGTGSHLSAPAVAARVRLSREGGAVRDARDALVRVGLLVPTGKRGGRYGSEVRGSEFDCVIPSWVSEGRDWSADGSHSGSALPDSTQVVDSRRESDSHSGSALPEDAPTQVVTQVVTPVVETRSDLLRDQIPEEEGESETRATPGGTTPPNIAVYPGEPEPAAEPAVVAVVSTAVGGPGTSPIVASVNEKRSDETNGRVPRLSGHDRVFLGQRFEVSDEFLLAQAKTIAAAGLEPYAVLSGADPSANGSREHREQLIQDHVRTKIQEEARPW